MLLIPEPSVRSRIVPGLVTLILITGCSASSGTTADEPPQTAGRTDSEESLRAAHIANIQRTADATYAAKMTANEVRADNPAQRLRFQLSDRGLQVTPTTTASWQTSLTLQRAGCERQLQAVAAAEPPQVSGNRIEYRRAGLREWYVNGPLGLEQGFDVERQPGCGEGDGLLLELALAGTLRPREEARSATSPQLAFVDENGRSVLSFGELYAFDAAGKTLPATLEVAGMSVRLRIDDRAARYPVTVDPLIANQLVRFSPSDGKTGDWYGYAVALNGDTALIGAWSADLPGKLNAGAAYVYTRVAGFWGLQAKLTAADADLGDSFGTSVALEGDTAVVGAYNATVAGKAQAGAAYVFTRAGTTWTQQAKLVSGDTEIQGFFGASVAVQADTAVVGSDWADLGATAQAGAAYVFVRTGTTWAQQAKLTAADATADAYFGNALSLHGETALIGAYYAPVAGKTLAGAAYVFTRAGTTWTQQTKLVAADASSGDHFGIAVSMNVDTALVGAYQATAGGKSAAGAAYVFTRAGTAWTQQAKLTGSAPDSSAQFGRAVSVDNNTAIIGAPFPSYLMPQGYAYVFTRAGTTWSEQLRVDPKGEEGPEEFGTAVALSGTTFVVGAPHADGPMVRETGVAYFERISNGKIDGTACLADADCENGHCVDTVCCDTACGGNLSNDCLVCNTAKGAAKNGVCGVANNAQICRQLAGDCDILEFCDGTSTVCPPDGFKSTVFGCRAASGICDVAENCSGTSAFCPTNVFKPNTTQCRAKADVCDQAEFCSGSAADCPADAFQPTTTECRPVTGDCDTPEFCSGTYAPCPLNSYKPFGTVCRAETDDCDKPESCNGSSASCPTDSFKPRTTVCRPAAGDCDVAESCTGTGASCPADLLKSITTVCRLAAGDCDVAESCTGTEPSCPADALRPRATQCRGAAGVCDQAESCDGTQPTCPTDQFKGSGTVCRESAGLCDVSESCTGSSVICPQDTFQPIGFQCRPASVPGDPAELCAGSSADCPPDVQAGKKDPSAPAGAMSTGCQMGGLDPAPGAAFGLWWCAANLALLLRRRRPNGQSSLWPSLGLRIRKSRSARRDGDALRSRRQRQRRVALSLCHGPAPRRS